MTHDETVERIEKAISSLEEFAGPHTPPHRRARAAADGLRAALSALPERAFIVTPGGIGEPSTIQPADNRELLREALSALAPFEKSAQRDWDEDAEDDTEIWSSQGPGWSVSRDCYTVGDLRRARAAADKIRAALEQQKGEGL